MRRRCVVLLGMVMVGACGMAAEDTSSVEQETGGGCPAWQCSNSPEVIHYGIHELNLRGLPNAQGAYLQTSTAGLAQIYSGGLAYDLHVTHGYITGTRHGSPPLTGTGLIGSKLVVMNHGVALFEIHITGVRTMQFLVGTAGSLEVYTMTWSLPGGLVTKTNACNGPVMTDQNELFDMFPQETLVFEGDRVDPTTMTVGANPDPNWFNFGCAGFTLAKMRLTRNTSLDEPSAKLRTATLKLLVADYCGIGKPLTISGVPLRWKGGAMYYATTPVTLEARWTDAGATCLRTPRLLELVPPPDAFPDPWAAILAVCHPPPCTGLDLDPDYMGTSMRVSALPAP